MVELIREQFANLMSRRAFEPVRRHLTGNDADDRLAEGIGMVWEMALRKAEQGFRLDDALLVHAVRLRAIEIRREFVKGRQPRRDVM
jgi:Arc/MetJ family transcription regulator